MVKKKKGTSVTFSAIKLKKRYRWSPMTVLEERELVNVVGWVKRSEGGNWEDLGKRGEF